MAHKRLCIVLHLNQNVTANVCVAAATSYRLLFEFLNRDASRRVTLHVSGTLLIALGWLEPGLVGDLRSLVDAGQIELLGSTFAQNIPWVSAAPDNELQVALHRRWLFELFGQRPRGFWNPERCWGNAYVELIAQHGYDYTFLEDQIIESGGLPIEDSIAVVSTSRGRLLLVRDDRALRHLMNATVWGNGWEQLDRYLTSSPRRHMFFAEDGEAVGLWALEHGHDPRLHWQRMEEMVSRLQQRSDVTLCTCSEALADVEPIPIRTPQDGQASWMVDALNQPAARFHEGGYRDWFDYASRSERLRNQVALIDATRQATLEVLTKRDALTPIEAQIQIAFCTHEYELGCIGVLDIGPGQFNKIRYAALLAKIRDRLRDADAGNTAPWLALEDRPGSPKLDTWITERDLIALGPRGEIAFWFDRPTGNALCGNAVETSIEDDDDDLPAVDEVQRWMDGLRERVAHVQPGDLEHLLPAEFREGFRPAERRQRVRDRFEASHADLYLFQGTAAPLIAVGQDIVFIPIDPAVLHAPRRLPLLGTGRKVGALTYSGTELTRDGLEARWTSDRVSLHRHLVTTSTGLRIRDTITRHDDVDVQYTARHSFSPGYDRLLLRGMVAMTPVLGDGRPCGWTDRFDGVFNTDAGIGIQLRDYGAATVSCPGSGLLCTVIDLVWAIERGARGPVVAEYMLHKLTAISPDPDRPSLA